MKNYPFGGAKTALLAFALLTSSFANAKVELPSKSNPQPSFIKNLSRGTYIVKNNQATLVPTTAKNSMSFNTQKKTTEGISWWGSSVEYCGNVEIGGLTAYWVSVYGIADGDYAEFSLDNGVTWQAPNAFVNTPGDLYQGSFGDLEVSNNGFYWETVPTNSCVGVLVRPASNPSDVLWGCLWGEGTGSYANNYR